MILIAPDKFKGTMSAETAAHCIASTLSLYGYESIKFPMADGGEGTAMILAHIYGLQPESCVPKCYVKSDGTVGVMEPASLRMAILGRAILLWIRIRRNLARHCG